MAKQIHFLVILMLSTSIIFFSCKDDDTKEFFIDYAKVADITGIQHQETDGFKIRLTEKCGENIARLSGTIDKNITLGELNDNYHWVLSGSVNVQDGVTLTINQGTTIYFDATSAQTSYLAIQQGAKIMAEGSVNNRILLTSTNELGSCTRPEGGDWGGLVVNGKATINVGMTAEGEGGSGTYGGNNDSDNSGVITYVVLKYAGRVIGVDNELNGFSFNGVGSETTIHHIQSYMGEDDGIEFFGGTVSVKYAISTGSKDDSFDWTHGWRGNGQFWVVEQLDGRGDRGIEADNLEDNFEAEPYSNPTLSNITLVGSNGNEGATMGMRLRHGTKGQIHNAIVTGFMTYGIRADDDMITESNVNSGDLNVSYSNIFGLNESATAWGKAGDIWENTNNNINVDMTLLRVIGTLNGGTDASELGTWFTPTNYIGAVDQNENWMQGWAIDSEGNDL